jgi:hypothetical protein
VGNGSGLSRGDRNRNARLARLRELVPVSNAIVAIDLADGKQMLVVVDHDSRVVARRVLRCRVWQLGAALEWAAGRATAAGFAGVTVACEPTGHRWQVVGQLAAERGMPFVCVQTLLVAWARRNEDLTRDKTDDRDAMRLAEWADHRCAAADGGDVCLHIWSMTQRKAGQSGYAAPSKLQKTCRWRPWTSETSSTSPCTMGLELIADWGTTDSRPLDE